MIALDEKEARKVLHKTIIKKMREDWLICSRADIVEAFKRKFLWKYFQVETSRALDAERLNAGIDQINSLQREDAIQLIQSFDRKYNLDRFVKRASDGQIRKISGINFNHFNMKLTELAVYCEKTFGRKPWLWDITIDEADQLIKRLEKWELKDYKDNRKKRNESYRK